MKTGVTGKKTAIDIAKNVAKEVFIPFTIGGGIRSVSDIEALLKAGADKVSISTAAVSDPSLLQKASYEFGSQAIVLSLDVKSSKQGSWKVYTKSASDNSQLDAVNWAKKAVELGAGEILLNSIDSDGTKNGFDIELNKTISESVSVPVIASGGAGYEADFLKVFQKTKVSAALAASVFHFGKIRINNLKNYLKNNGVDVRV